MNRFHSLFLTLLLFICCPVFACIPDSAITIVVLGSSTAAGIGSSVSDSSWVGRYSAYIHSINPGNTVINLAISATTTYQIMPDGNVPPAGAPNPIPSNNISKAIELNADAIIINMPSNDAFFGIDAGTQMKNFKVIAQKADSAGIPLWVATTQPRNMLPAQIQIQLAVRDSVQLYFADKAIDFWTTIADTNNFINSLYNSGDDIHLNDRGHRILFERVVEKNIPSRLMDSCMVGLSRNLNPLVVIYPNPVTSYLTIANLTGDHYFQLYNLAGMPVYKKWLGPGTNNIILSELPAGIYLYQISGYTGLIKIHRE